MKTAIDLAVEEMLAAFPSWFPEQAKVDCIKKVTESVRQMTQKLHDDNPKMTQMFETMELLRQHMQAALGTQIASPLDAAYDAAKPVIEAGENVVEFQKKPN